MRFLLRLLPLEADRATALTSVRTTAAALQARAVNPKWTSYGALEIDIFSPSRQDFYEVVEALGALGKMEFAKDLQEPPRFQTKQESVSEAVALFNAERYWEAHEVLESLWRVAEGEEKKLLQGLILVCAALVHHQKDEEKVALGITARALKLLSWNEPLYFEIDVRSLRETMALEEKRGRLSSFMI
jgi:hypothetical protein